MAQPQTHTVTMDQQQWQPTTQTVIVTEQKPNACRAAIPAMPIALAVVCLILNIFLPGIGTIVAGFSVFCCANPGQSDEGKVGTMCLNFWVGILQLFLVLIFFIGWVWSIMWGVAFIALSADYHKHPQTTTTVIQSGGPVGPPGQMAPPYNQPPPPAAYAQPPPEKM
ncbi:protein SPEC3-like [Diadema antillarum]|uniref:protein SPEC3-like n=1 Tax=Diadema antillarum TaxID=105358 RepID=UPI003A8C3C71